MRYVFQPSKIWESGDPPDTTAPVKVVKAKSEERARRLLPKPELGRTWVLVETKP